ncbi:MAG: hypothetical protein ACI4M0_03715 [Christensenellales bacterium]
MDFYIVYAVICLAYLIFGVVFSFVTKKKISKKLMVILTGIMLVLFVVYTVYFWCSNTGEELIERIQDYFLILVTAVTGIWPLVFFICKNLRLSSKEILREADPDIDEKLKTLKEYKKMLRKKLITKEEYEQKENELFGDDDLKADDVVGTDGVVND